MKDNTNQTLLQLICKKIYDDDSDFLEQAKLLNKAVQIKETDTKYIKTKTGELQAVIGQARAAMGQITGSGDPHDRFMECFEVILRDAGIEMEQFNRNLKEIQEKHAYMTAYFGIDKNDEMNDKSEDFFKVFQSFFKQVENSLPKPTKKPAPKK